MNVQEVHKQTGVITYQRQGMKAAITTLIVCDCLIYSPDNFKWVNVLKPFTYIHDIVHKLYHYTYW